MFPVDAIVILILVVYGAIHVVSLAHITAPVSAKIFHELTEADLYIHHEIELVHGYLINPDGREMLPVNIAENIEENLEILERLG